MRRVCILGAESTGKTTLARALADVYGTFWNPECGRVSTEVGPIWAADLLPTVSSLSSEDARMGDGLVTSS